MTTCHEREAALNDYVDDLLDDAGRNEVERHLERCESCRATVEELRSLLRRSASLPGLPPSRDLFPGIRRRLAYRSPRWGRTAAAAVLVIGLAGLLGWMMRGEPGSSNEAAEVVLAEYRAAEQQYLEATDRLMRLLEQRREALPPETLRVVEENLGIIDNAIGRARLAFEQSGAEAREGHVLTALYDKKLQLLWRASRLSVAG